MTWMRPRPLVVTVRAAFLLAVASTATLTCSRKPRPALEIEPSPMDFGMHTFGDNPEMTVKVTNRADHAVNLQDPTFSCGCFALVAPPAKSRLESGESLEMKVVMRTLLNEQLDDRGRMHKVMTIASDDPVRPKLDTPIVGDVVDYRVIEPKQPAFGAVPAAGPAQEKRVTVRGGHGSTVTVKSAVPDDPKRIQVEVKPVEGGADLVVRTVVGAAKGRFSVQVRLVLEVRTVGGDAHSSSEVIWVTGDVE